MRRKRDAVVARAIWCFDWRFIQVEEKAMASPGFNIPNPGTHATDRGEQDISCIAPVAASGNDFRQRIFDPNAMAAWLRRHF
jgi:hypothetical protein